MEYLIIKININNIWSVHVNLYEFMHNNETKNNIKYKQHV
jgi:hypothetical protein